MPVLSATEVKAKFCPYCNKHLLTTDFYWYINPWGTKVHRGRCRKCDNLKKREWVERNRARHKAYFADYRAENKEKRREYDMRRSAGISAKDYDDLLQLQNGLCAICQKPGTGRRTRRLSVDHCHATGKIRGLLCSNCNRGLGLLGDTAQSVKVALAYLARDIDHYPNREPPRRVRHG